jgi:glycosyltransferase involved in cell wall biosynthesis
VFISEFQRRRAPELTDATVAHPGVDPARFPLAPAPAEWGGRLACVGRIDPRKGLGVALDAVRALPDVTLTITGAGDAGHLDHLRERAGDNVRFAGTATRPSPTPPRTPCCSRSPGTSRSGSCRWRP